LLNINQDILQAHKTGSEETAYDLDKDMISTAMSGASGLSSFAFDSPFMDIDIGSMVSTGRRLNMQSRIGAAVVRMQGSILAKELNSSTQSAETALLQFQRIVKEALSGGSNSAFLSLLRDKYIQGTSLDSYVDTSSEHISRVKIFTSRTGNTPVIFGDGNSPTLVPTRAPSKKPSRVPSKKPK